jgi:hypothetical protein
MNKPNTSNQSTTQPSALPADAAAQLMGSVPGGVKDSYFVSKLLVWYWKRFKQFCFGKQSTTH